MEKEIWQKKLKSELNDLNLMFHEKQLDQFYNYMNILLEENEKINLTAITDPEEIITKHFIDSLTIYKYIGNASKIIDIGTGAGFPGIPLKIINPNLNITLVDSLNKRINFINMVKNYLNLTNIDIIHARAEEHAKQIKYREKYDIATSRAVASLNVLLEYLMPYVKIGGKCICMKGSNIDEELKESTKAIQILGGKIEKIEEITLPNTDIKRNIIIIKKEKQTPNSYPRKAGIPSKKPIVS